MYIYMYICMCVYICIHICIYIYIYIYTYVWVSGPTRKGEVKRGYVWVFCVMRSYIYIYIYMYVYVYIYIYIYIYIYMCIYAPNCCLSLIGGLTFKGLVTKRSPIGDKQQLGDANTSFEPHSFALT